MDMMGLNRKRDRHMDGHQRSRSAAQRQNFNRSLSVHQFRHGEGGVSGQEVMEKGVQEILRSIKLQ